MWRPAVPPFIIINQSFKTYIENLGEYEFPRKRVLMPQICLASTADLTAARYQLPKEINRSSASCEYGPGT